MKVNDYKNKQEVSDAYHQHCEIRSKTDIPPDRNIPTQPLTLTAFPTPIPRDF